MQTPKNKRYQIGKKFVCQFFPEGNNAATVIQFQCRHRKCSVSLWDKEDLLRAADWLEDLRLMVLATAADRFIPKRVVANGKDPESVSTL